MDLDYTGTNSAMVLEVPLGAVDRPSHMPLDFLQVLARHSRFPPFAPHFQVLRHRESERER